MFARINHRARRAEGGRPRQMTSPWPRPRRRSRSGAVVLMGERAGLGRV